MLSGSLVCVCVGRSSRQRPWGRWCVLLSQVCVCQQIDACSFVWFLSEDYSADRFCPGVPGSPRSVSPARPVLRSLLDSQVSLEVNLS